MYINFLLDRFNKNKKECAVIWNDKEYTYGWLMQCIQHFKNELKKNKELEKSVVSLEADYSPYSIAMLLSLLDKGCIVVPIQDSLVPAIKAEYDNIAEVEQLVKITGDTFEIKRKNIKPVKNKLLVQLKNQHHPGLILFSSGTTGRSKTIVHDFTLLLNKFSEKRNPKRIIPFMLFDHIGGINTLFQVLSSTGCLVIIQERSPLEVGKTIERYKVQALPVTPTFINLFLINETYRNYDLTSLETISYGSEVMPESTLKAINKILPGVKIFQTYGLSEVGVLSSQSKHAASLWVKIWGEGVKTRIVDGVLQIKSNSSMLGYINAPSPFTEDGWLNTGDIVEQDGEYIRILGRKSEIINVGGEKVFPAEVESVLRLINGVEEVVVNAATNAITGQMVKAAVRLNTNESLGEFRIRMRHFCRDKLPSYKIPQKVVLTSKELYTNRFKKNRKLV
ncbi:fatty acid--CoA ligase family protein [Salipaludibacillus sp. LMS25]|jgi:acyl-CoA synthetase (AMP-forming)/AMP-acid ligase II|uniref:ANL family adenylate-forming protein n=1 Tax=Salipaludibacillus sp. LMS25 TaxID=2924031 RepID=UPI0020D0AFD8|nr:fatty acid--CoA ligase family protein [Salipaludibacillus sp. LMS25]UTR16854.1 fatty acid--CoA ligase family protein [Salipaludibacillus sp. LMS25]